MQPDAKNLIVYIPVIIEIDQDRIHVVRGVRKGPSTIPELIKSVLGSFSGNSEALGIILCPLEAK